MRNIGEISAKYCFLKNEFISEMLVFIDAYELGVEV